MLSSRIAGFFRMSPAQRARALADAGWLSEADARRLSSGEATLDMATADHMIENVVGVFGLPVGVALNFIINGRDMVLPMAVEEPSIVAGLSGTAKLARPSGGFHYDAPEPLITGQIQLVGCSDEVAAKRALDGAKSRIIEHANMLQPNMVARGGGVVDVETHLHTGPESGETMVVVHLLIDSRDAMGANLVNAICEGVAPLAETISGGRAVLRILSNLTDRSIVRARVQIPTEQLAGRGMRGEAVRDGIIIANDLALVDPYRAATHNKGIMNGVDAITVATGNDWRAIEAGAHAYAARSGTYRALTRWYRAANGDLAGEIEIPVKVGTVGGSLQSNPAVMLAHRLLGSPNATDLAGIIGVVGLAQNLAALRSLATNGIQSNHMRLHARSVVSTANTPEHLFDRVVEELVASGEIKLWKAREILQSLTPDDDAHKQPTGTQVSAAGKVILLGEHAAVYGEPAIAIPLESALSARAEHAERGWLSVPAWQIEQPLDGNGSPVLAALQRILERHDLSADVHIHVDAALPIGMGLGGSAALAVAMLRAVDQLLTVQWTDEQINALAFELEKAAHGNPSGVDNTVATYGRAVRFTRRQNEGQSFADLTVAAPLPLIIGLTASPGSTASMVDRVHRLRSAHAAPVQEEITSIGRLVGQALDAIAAGDLARLGMLMNLCHGHLNALQVSTPDLETLVHVAREAGALGAKLTGGGGGGSIVALAESAQAQQQVLEAIRSAGFEGFPATVT